jgi:hypothetical protein
MDSRLCGNDGSVFQPVVNNDLHNFCLEMLFCYQEPAIHDDTCVMKAKFLPLGIKNRTKTELPALIALEAIGQPWFCESHRNDLLSIALVTQLIADADSEIHFTACELAYLMESSHLQVDEIRPRAIAVNQWLQLQPNGRIQGAIDKLLRWEARHYSQLACA